jgi:crossover junction endodeoxyribonuclease RuvC
MHIQAYLGIDPSLTCTGLGLLLDSDGHLELRVTEVPTGKFRGTERLRYIRDSVQDYIKDLPAVFCTIESASLFSVNRADALGQLRGALLVFLEDHEIPTLEIPPTVLKKWATSRGSASKQQMQDAAFAKWGRQMSEDEADAAWLAHLAYAYYTPVPLEELERHKIEVLAGIRKPKAKREAVRTHRALNV